MPEALNFVTQFLTSWEGHLLQPVNPPASRPSSSPFCAAIIGGITPIQRRRQQARRVASGSGWALAAVSLVTPFVTPLGWAAENPPLTRANVHA
jgi:hypothetical protein